MALKADRVIIETDITMTCESAQSRGVVLVVTTDGSGVAIGERAGKADVKADPSGFKVHGLLLHDVESVDETRYHRNFHKHVEMVGQRCTVVRKGRLTTDKVIGSPTDGAVAYLVGSGNLAPGRSATGGLVATPKVGVFRSKKDESGFATVDINLPIAE